MSLDWSSACSPPFSPVSSSEDSESPCTPPPSDFIFDLKDLAQGKFQDLEAPEWKEFDDMTEETDAPSISDTRTSSMESVDSVVSCPGSDGKERCVMVFPRRKMGQMPLGRNRSPVKLSKPLIESMFFLRQPEAAESLGLSSTALKKVCRKLGIIRWPAPGRYKPGDLPGNPTGNGEAPAKAPVPAIIKSDDAASLQPQLAAPSTSAQTSAALEAWNQAVNTAANDLKVNVQLNAASLNAGFNVGFQQQLQQTLNMTKECQQPAAQSTSSLQQPFAFPGYNTAQTYSQLAPAQCGTMGAAHFGQGINQGYPAQTVTMPNIQVNVGQPDMNFYVVDPFQAVEYFQSTTLPSQNLEVPH